MTPPYEKKFHSTEKSGEGHIRLSYCYSDSELRESLDRLERFIGSL